MNRVFADTFYFLAILNPKDQAHAKAVHFSESHDASLTTTSWVLTELADGLSRSTQRRAFGRILADLANDPETILVPPSQSLFDEGVKLYNARSDKNWSLTDCISFVVMRQYGMSDALTADHHFEQAGFVALLK